MERTDKIMTQEEYCEIMAQITRLELQQSLTGADLTEQINALREKLR